MIYEYFQYFARKRKSNRQFERADFREMMRKGL